MRRSFPRTDWAKRARGARRHTVIMNTTPESEMGNRPGLERVFGLDGPEWSLEGATFAVGSPALFRALARHWFLR